MNDLDELRRQLSEYDDIVIHNGLSISPRRSVKIGTVLVKSNAKDEYSETDIKDSFKRELIKDDDVDLQSNQPVLDKASLKENDDKDSLERYNEVNITVMSEMSSESDDSNSNSSYYTLPAEIYDLSSLNPVVRIRKLEEPINVQTQLLLDKIDQNWKKAMPRRKLNETNAIQCKNRQNNIKDVPWSLSPNSIVNSQYNTDNSDVQLKSVPKPVLSYTIRSPAAVLQKDSTSTGVLSSQNCEVMRDNFHEISDADEVKIEHFKLELPIKKKRNKKIFYVHLADLISLVKKKNHPLHKWAHLITVDNVKCLSKKNYEEIVSILTEFLEVRAVSH